MEYVSSDMKLLPYGMMNFEDIRLDNYYYVDKTSFIPLIERSDRYFFFIRPRRFGKSLTLNMLQHYYDVRTRDKFDALFGDLYIGKHPTDDRNSYLVLYLNFSGITGELHNYRSGLDAHCSITFENFCKIYAEYLPQDTLEGLCAAKGAVEQLDFLYQVCARAGQKIYLFIDEYDHFTNAILSDADSLRRYTEETHKEGYLRAFFNKVKAGTYSSIKRCFITGVSPVTMDDLTSGYNIAEILTLESDFINMLGFTHAEADAYLRYVLDKYTGSQERYDEIWQLIVNNYDGYRFSPKGEKLFNATILTYFLKNFATRHGEVPEEMIDENLRTDIGWLRRLTLSLENSKAMLDALVIDNGLYYNVADLSSKFNKQKFFDKNFYPVSLFYLGMTTLQNNFRMALPNLTMRSIYMDYYNVLNRIDGGANRYVPTYERFVDERDFESLVRNYFEQYLGQFPAQVFDKINENFIRCSFFELVSRYLSSCYTFAIEQNNSEGRADFEMTGIPGTDYYTDDRLVEFKYYKAKEAEKMLELDAPLPEHVEQVHRYAEDTLRHFPNYKVRTYVVYICANRGWKCWET